MTNYPVGDYLIQIKNAARSQKREVVVKESRFIRSVSECLKKMGILESVSVKDKMLTSTLAYHKKAPVLMDLKLVSKPGLRRYLGVEEIAGRKRRNSSLLVLSTPIGILSSKDALKKSIGGEVIAEIW